MFRPSESHFLFILSIQIAQLKYFAGSPFSLQSKTRWLQQLTKNMDLVICMSTSIKKLFPFSYKKYKSYHRSVYPCWCQESISLNCFHRAMTFSISLTQAAIIGLCIANQILQHSLGQRSKGRISSTRQGTFGSERNCISSLQPSKSR